MKHLKLFELFNDEDMDALNNMYRSINFNLESDPEQYIEVLETYPKRIYDIEYIEDENVLHWKMEKIEGEEPEYYEFELTNDGELGVEGYGAPAFGGYCEDILNPHKLKIALDEWLTSSEKWTCY